jgi:hypothetical protein
LNEIVKAALDKFVALNVDTYDNMAKCANAFSESTIRTANVEDPARRFLAELAKQDPV